MALKCPEKIGNIFNQANNMQYAMNKRSNITPNPNSAAHAHPIKFKIPNNIVSFP